MNRHFRLSPIPLIAVVLTLPLFCTLAQSPSAIGGRTLELTISSGTFPFASSGKSRFLPSAVNDSYAIVPISGEIAATRGTHEYSKTGANTAALSFVDDQAGGFTANVTFNTPASGTYTVTSTAFPGGSQSGTFVLYAGASPDTIAGSTITVSITSGEFPFAEFGSYRFIAAANGNTYIVEALSGDVADSSGTYSYSKNSDHTGVINYNDELAGQGLTSQFSFDSPTTGTIFLLKSGSTGYQTGVFSMTTPSIAPSITAHPTSRTVNAGANVEFTVSAIGTAPLTYQWRKDGVNINGASLASYAISSAQPTDQGGYDVVVSNSAGSVTSSVANLVVVVPPTITSHPTNLAVPVEESAGFTVSATGTAPLSYQWQRNGSDITGANLSSYTIGNVQASDGGTYSVRVSNAAGSVNSNPATLEVILIATEPPRLDGPVWNQTSGFSITLHGETQTAYRVQWSADLATWFDLTNFVSETAATQIYDPDAATGGMRLYRALSP